jgi:deoxyribodipyrimidine photo-lyase
MTNLFIFHRDLRLNDNTALIKQIKQYGSIVPIFIFTPEQINPSINNYFSNNSVQFMIESLNDLNNNIKKYNGKIYFYESSDIIALLKKLNKLQKINSIGFNLDYTPYAIKRDEEIINFAHLNDINIITAEDIVLYDIMKGITKNKNNNNPYIVFTPFKNHCLKNLQVKKPDKFNKFLFIKVIKYNFDLNDINHYYKDNPYINIHGGRHNGLKILSKLNNFKDYNKERDYLMYKTTFLSAHLHFCTLSIREVYYKIINILGSDNNLINELHWRDFYMNITYYFPKVLKGFSFKEKYDNIKWDNNNILLNAWKNGQTGFPIIDAAMRQLNKTGYMHNRCRMIVASFLTKDLHIDWRIGEKYFANNLIDYSPMQNNGGWQWASSSGCDSQPYFRIFNPWTQSKKYDIDCKYIKYWIPELINVPNKEIHNWFKYYNTYNIYYKPIIDHDIERKKTLILYKKYLK